jgi:endonuclease/exonuclease/phosphatase family metal-dependent hydrolase
MQNSPVIEVAERSGTKFDDDESTALRVVSYNIHGCVDAVRKVDPLRLAGIIGEIDADVVALQEVDAEKPFSRDRNQARIIGEALDLEYLYFPVENTGPHAFGLAILSRYPIEQSIFIRLPNLYPGLNPRKRGGMLATLGISTGRVHLINTHLSVFKVERHSQLNAVLSWTGFSASLSEPTIFCGDLNAGPRSLTCCKLSRYLTNVQKFSARGRLPQATFHSRSPLFRIDHIFVSDHFMSSRAEVVRTPQTVKASDHLPLVADLKIKFN